MPTALVIQHVAYEGLGNLAPILEERGFRLQYWQTGVDAINSKYAATADLLVILGGPIGVYDNKEYPFLDDEINFIQKRLAAKRPILGICLGSQLMASALGAKVYPGLVKEIGWGPLTLTEQGEHSPLQLLSSQHTSIFHWHGDTFDLPSEAKLLASTDDYPNQAFTIGDYGLALQFHPEITADDLECWLIANVAEIDHSPNLTVNNLRDESQKHLAKLQKQANLFWHAWLDTLPIQSI